MEEPPALCLGEERRAHGRGGEHEAQQHRVERYQAQVVGPAHGPGHRQRPPEEYAAGHLPGAVNVPLAELERCLGDCDPAKEVVAYCRGPWCVLAYEAVARLREKGVKARRLEGGLPEWRQAGLPVEQDR